MDEYEDVVREPTAAYSRKRGEPSEISEDGLAVSLGDYWKYYLEHPYFNYEWNRGILEEKPVSDLEEAELFKWFCDLMEEYLKAFPEGRLIPLDMALRLGKGPTSVRKPDRGLILKTNPSSSKKIQCYV